MKNSRVSSVLPQALATTPLEVWRALNAISFSALPLAVILAHNFLG